ncbi:MAG: hypothetical protein ACK4N5_24115, partial [Myxococcales bacterium]
MRLLLSTAMLLVLLSGCGPAAPEAGAPCAATERRCGSWCAPCPGGATELKCDETSSCVPAKCEQGRRICADACCFLGTDEAIDRDGRAGELSDVAIAADGTLHALYVDPAAQELRHATRRPGASWSIARVAAAKSPHALAMQLDADGRPHACFGSDEGLHYVRPAGAGLELEKVASSRLSGYACALALDGRGIPHL